MTEEEVRRIVREEMETRMKPLEDKITDIHTRLMDPKSGFEYRFIRVEVISGITAAIGMAALLGLVGMAVARIFNGS